MKQPRLSPGLVGFWGQSRGAAPARRLGSGGNGQRPLVVLDQVPQRGFQWCQAVRYEDLVSHSEREARRVQDYLGLPTVDGVTDILANTKVTTTASTLQLRQPIHTRNIAGWRRYAHGLAPLEAKLRDLIQDYEAPLAAAA